MLVLYRKVNETIEIEGGIVIKVAKILLSNDPHSHAVKLGIDAPGLRVDRGEVARAIAAQGYDPRPPLCRSPLPAAGTISQRLQRRRELRRSPRGPEKEDGPAASHTRMGGPR